MKHEDAWRAGYPEEIGAYACKVNGQEKTLLHKYCQLNGKHRWMTLQGGDAIGEIFWREKITDVKKIK